MGNYEVYMECTDCGELTIKRSGEVTLVITDDGEPEDGTFARDWNWVPGELESAYDFGLEDGVSKVNSSLKSTFKEIMGRDVLLDEFKSYNAFIHEIYEFGKEVGYDDGYRSGYYDG